MLPLARLPFVTALAAYSRDLRLGSTAEVLRDAPEHATAESADCSDIMAGAASKRRASVLPNAFDITLHTIADVSHARWEINNAIAKHAGASLEMGGRSFRIRNANRQLLSNIADMEDVRSILPVPRIVWCACSALNTELE